MSKTPICDAFVSCLPLLRTPGDGGPINEARQTLKQTMCGSCPYAGPADAQDSRHTRALHALAQMNLLPTVPPPAAQAAPAAPASDVTPRECTLGMRCPHALRLACREPASGESTPRGGAGDPRFDRPVSALPHPLCSARAHGGRAFVSSCTDATRRLLGASGLRRKGSKFRRAASGEA